MLINKAVRNVQGINQLQSRMFLTRVRNAFKKEPEYYEQFNHAWGRQEGTLGGFARLARNYQGVKKVIDKPVYWQKDHEIYYNHLKYRTRIRAFLTTKRKRLMMVLAFVLAFNYLGNVTGLILGSIERSFKKFKMSFLMKY